MQTTLTEKQRQILNYLARHEPGQRAIWIAEGCDHWYRPEWAHSGLTALAKRGFVEKLTRDSWAITDAGEDVLRPRA